MSGIVGTSHSKSKVIGRSQDTAKAWVHFDATGTPAIQDSFGVSSITDNATGKYTVTFSKAFSNANYSAVATCSFFGNAMITTVASGSIAIWTTYEETDAYWDYGEVTLQVFGD